MKILIKKQPRYLSFSVFLIIISLMFSCGVSNLVVEGSFPTPNINKIPLTMAVYYDEAHNSTAKNFFPSVEHYSEKANRSYYFTATPKHSVTINKAGMNDEEVYGKVLKQVPAPKLVQQGHILPPKVIVKKIDVNEESINESQHIIDTIDEINVKKVLVCARSTKQIVSLAASNMVGDLQSRGYSLLYITAKTGAFIDGKKVSRDKFFDVLNTWGKDCDKKFIVLHHSILSEGISVRGLEAAILLRNMDIITLSQTIGRVIRTADIIIS